MRDETWITRLPGLGLSPELQSTLVSGSEVVDVIAGSTIFEPGMAADRLLLLLDGTICVRQRSEKSRDVTLHRVSEGDSCILTTACVLAFEDYSAEGVEETGVRAVAIPRKTFDEMIVRSPVFREFIFKAYPKRITDLFSLVDDIVFQRMDVRLAVRLWDLADAGGVVRATHQSLGTEHGTARGSSLARCRSFNAVDGSRRRGESCASPRVRSSSGCSESPATEAAWKKLFLKPAPAGRGRAAPGV
ncbi:MAG: Crp/Fnr family transcriptional regulator [Pseudomonadota bacterium]